ncbi:hypothetical protein P5775_11320 [Bacillus cereus]|uniref:hypothetical protein n=1 Tax=Bacillus cereus TaxID=1396 RepID=UPI002406B4C9|nr:hypothetical protein [Bacillus cereus]MDF9623361.1 hypothetical protein [Bacillus cereus]
MLRTRGRWNSWRRGAFCLVGRRETTDCSSRCSWMKPKAKAARSECEGDGASDVEALFAS